MASKALRDRFPWHNFRCEDDGCYTCACEGEAIHATLRKVRDFCEGWDWYGPDLKEAFGPGGKFEVGEE